MDEDRRRNKCPNSTHNANKKGIMCKFSGNTKLWLTIVLTGPLPPKQSVFNKDKREHTLISVCMCEHCHIYTRNENSDPEASKPL